MTVNPPGDAFEQETDAVARAVTASEAGPQAQRQDVPEEEEEPQMQDAEEEEVL